MVLNDRRFSADRQHPDFPQRVKGGAAVRQQGERTMVAMDAPEHGPARRAVLGEFTVRRMEALRPRIQEIVDGQIDALLAGPKPGELVETLSLPAPSLETVHGYLVGLIAEKEENPPDDLLGRQIVKLRANGTYRRASLAATGFLLLAAGHETTANMISLSTVALLRHPEQLAAIRAEPGLTLDAVEEMLRFWTIGDSMARLCVEDVEVGGQLIRAGEGVLALGYSANRDPRAFDNPDELDVERGARHHVAFGFGPHQYLGQNLARMELQMVFDTLFRRVPTLALAADVDELRFKDDANIYGLYRLLVTW
jgi:cytochrome P450